MNLVSRLHGCASAASIICTGVRTHESLTRSWQIVEMVEELLAAGTPASVVLALISYAKGMPRLEIGPDLKTIAHACVLPGWDCPACHVFNGDAKELLTKCRCCEAPRPL